MSPRPGIVALLVIAGIAFGAPRRAAACECGFAPFGAFYDEARAIVIAERISPSDVEGLVTFRTLDVIKGTVAATYTIDEWSAPCNYATEADAEYLLFLLPAAEGADASGPFYVPLCAPHMRLDSRGTYGLRNTTLATVRELAAQERARARDNASRSERLARADEENGHSGCAMQPGEASSSFAVFTPLLVALTARARRRR